MQNAIPWATLLDHIIHNQHDMLFLDKVLKIEETDYDVT